MSVESQAGWVTEQVREFAFNVTHMTLKNQKIAIADLIRDVKDECDPQLLKELRAYKLVLKMNQFPNIGERIQAGLKSYL